MTALEALEARELATYQHRTPQSRALFDRARQVLPGGDTRTGTFHAPYPLFVAPRRGLPPVGRRRPSVPRRPEQLHLARARPRARRGDAGHRRPGRQGHRARHRQRAPGDAGRGVVPAGAVGGARPLLQLGHRGHARRAPGRQGLHRPAEDPEDGRLLSRLARPGGGGRLGAVRRRCRRVCRPAPSARCCVGALQRPRTHGGAHPCPRPRTGGGDRRADDRHRRAAGRSRLPRRPARGDRRVRRAADLRRGHHLPARPRRPAGGARRSVPTSPRSARSSAAACRSAPSAAAPT